MYRRGDVDGDGASSVGDDEVEDDDDDDDVEDDDDDDDDEGGDDEDDDEDDDDGDGLEGVERVLFVHAEALIFFLFCFVAKDVDAGVAFALRLRNWHLRYK